MNVKSLITLERLARTMGRNDVTALAAAIQMRIYKTLGNDSHKKLTRRQSVTFSSFTVDSADIVRPTPFFDSDWSVRKK